MEPHHVQYGGSFLEITSGGAGPTSPGKNLPSSLFWGRRDKATNASHIITDGTGSHPGGQDPLDGCVIIPRDRQMVVENWGVVLCTNTCTSDEICLKIYFLECTFKML